MSAITAVILAVVTVVCMLVSVATAIYNFWLFLQAGQGERQDDQ